MKTTIAYISLNLLISFGCKEDNRIEKSMKGLWGIDSLIIDNVNYAQTIFSSNTIVFFENGSCNLPGYFINDREVGKGIANWELKDSMNQIYFKIYGRQNIITGEYICEPIFNSNSQLTNLRLKNQNQLIYLTKALSTWTK